VTFGLLGSCCSQLLCREHISKHFNTSKIGSATEATAWDNCLLPYLHPLGVAVQLNVLQPTSCIIIGNADVHYGKAPEVSQGLLLVQGVYMTETQFNLSTYIQDCYIRPGAVGDFTSRRY
jgi:hypothetical protein